MASLRFASMFISVICLSNLIASNCNSIFYSIINNKVPKNHTALFIFGDSLLDVGNNDYIDTITEYQSNFPPYGETFFNHPTGRFSDGRLIADFIAEYARLPPIPAYLDPRYRNEYINGVNFASGGAGVLLQTHKRQVIPLERQVRYFKFVAHRLRCKLGSSDANILLSNAVYMFSIGSNDVATYLNVTRSEYVSMVSGNLTSVIKDMYNTGARKFVFMNLPPFGCHPASRMTQSERGGDGCLPASSNFATVHNEAQSMALLQLQKQLEGVKFLLYDYSSDYTQMINYPWKYDIKEEKTACCGSGPFRGKYTCGGKRGDEQFEICDNPNEHIFWDAYHLTERANKHLATSMWGFIRGLFEAS